MKIRFPPLIGVLLIIALTLLLTWQVNLQTVAMSAFGSETRHAEVKQIIEEGKVDLGGTIQRYQIARVQLLEEEYQGIDMEMDYGKRQVLSSNVYLAPGDHILVTVGSRPDGILTVYFVDFVRVNPLLWLTAIFALAILVISRWTRTAFADQHGIQFDGDHQFYYSPHPIW